MQNKIEEVEEELIDFSFFFKNSESEKKQKEINLLEEKQLISDGSIIIDMDYSSNGDVFILAQKNKYEKLKEIVGTLLEYNKLFDSDILSATQIEQFIEKITISKSHPQFDFYINKQNYTYQVHVNPLLPQIINFFTKKKSFIATNCAGGAFVASGCIPILFDPERFINYQLVDIFQQSNTIKMKENFLNSDRATNTIAELNNLGLIDVMPKNIKCGDFVFYCCDKISWHAFVYLSKEISINISNMDNESFKLEPTQLILNRYGHCGISIEDPEPNKLRVFRKNPGIEYTPVIKETLLNLYNSYYLYKFSKNNFLNKVNLKENISILANKFKQQVMDAYCNQDINIHLKYALLKTYVIIEKILPSEFLHDRLKLEDLQKTMNSNDFL
ncbi:MAG: hypothetical protein HYX60_10830 [Legionella longbeachae]|nr:hypothetical protein [Legionella longbeachae]